MFASTPPIPSPSPGLGGRRNSMRIETLDRRRVLHLTSLDSFSPILFLFLIQSEPVPLFSPSPCGKLHLCGIFAIPFSVSLSFPRILLECTNSVCRFSYLLSGRRYDLYFPLLFLLKPLRPRFSLNAFPAARCSLQPVFGAENPPPCPLDCVIS